MIVMVHFVDVSVLNAGPTSSMASPCEVSWRAQQRPDAWKAASHVGVALMPAACAPAALIVSRKYWSVPGSVPSARLQAGPPSPCLLHRLHWSPLSAGNAGDPLTSIIAATPTLVIVIGKKPMLGSPTKHRPLGNPSALVVDGVFMLGSPPVQLPKLALAGDTVTDRKVCTVVSDRLRLAGLPAFCGAAPLMPHPATTRPASTALATTAAGHLPNRAA